MRGYRLLYSARLYPPEMLSLPDKAILFDGDLAADAWIF
jgi:hypothetical protein